VQAANGIDPGAAKQASKQVARAPAPKDIVEKVAAQFMARHIKGLAPATIREATRIFDKEIVPAWRGRRLCEISKGDIHELLDRIADRAPVQANRVLAWIKGMCNFAMGRGIIETTPCLGIKPPTTETARDRVLSDDELRAVWLASDSLKMQHSAFVNLLILTGQRRNKVSELCWSELDLDAALWTLPKERAKNHRQHEIPLSDSAVTILRALPRIKDSDYVLTFSGRGPIRGHYLVKGRLDALLPADMPAWVFHDLRRSVASGLARLGVNLPVIEKLLNHVSGSFAGIVSVYQRHSFADEKRIAMTTWARHVEAIVAGTTAANIVSIRA
jgi:integrase